MKIEKVEVSRGHMLFGLSDGRWAYVQGELVLGMKFYADYRGDWYWIHKPTRRIYLLSNCDIAAEMNGAEKDALSAAIGEYFSTTEFKVIVD